MKSLALNMSDNAAVAEEQKLDTPLMSVASLPHRHTIWALCDDRAGNVSQCLGVAEKLGLPYEIKNISYNKIARLPNLLLGSSARGLTAEALADIVAPWPDVVIAAGRRTAPIARYIKKQSAGKTRVVQMMWPEVGAADFDLIVTPNHDKVEGADNIFDVPCAPHRLTEDALRQSIGDWPSQIGPLPQPWIAVLLGGDSKSGPLSDGAAHRMAQEASRIAKEAGGSLLVTSSRRTRKETEYAFLRGITAPAFIYEYGRDENPYLAFLALSSAVIVSGDSVSMISEATYTGNPVYIFDRGANVSPKHRRFHESLYQEKVARPLIDSTYEESAIYTPVDIAAEVAGHIREWLK